jgi:hypothetical protein
LFKTLKYGPEFPERFGSLGGLRDGQIRAMARDAA